MKCFFWAGLILLSLVSACSVAPAGNKPTVELPFKNDVFHIYDERASAILDHDALLETLATGFKWSEGPVWSSTLNCLLFSDIPNHRVHKYCPDENRVSVYLENSGYSNGLAITAEDELILMQSRSRQVAKMQAPITAPRAQYSAIATNLNGMRLNSPNDISLHSDGSIYFTDPPYGLDGQLNDPAKELPFQGVYRIGVDGMLMLLDDALSYPNGIALSNDERQLFVAVSDEGSPAWYRYDVNDIGLLTSKTKIIDAHDHKIEGFETGLPDGLKVHASGLIFATGPGGVWVFDNTGAVLARILVPELPVANIGFDEDQNYIYLTAESHLFRVKIK